MMASRYRYLHLDVFTSEKFGGNQLAVFVDARGLSTVQMQAATREMNFSESTFILPAERADTDIRMRIFTPGREMPMAWLIRPLTRLASRRRREMFRRMGATVLLERTPVG